MNDGRAGGRLSMAMYERAVTCNGVRSPNVDSHIASGATVLASKRSLGVTTVNVPRGPVVVNR